MASGGVEISEYSALLHDQLLFNDGKGNFINPKQIFPNEQKLSTIAISTGDIDADGDMDLFVGERIKVGKYGAPCSGFIFENDGKANFKDVTDQYFPGLKEIGMITDAQWIDINGDKKLDLLVVGEFMEIYILVHGGGKLSRINLPFPNAGFWNRLNTSDVDGDQDLDLIVGNLGTNSRFEANADQPLRLYYNDYDQNGFPEGILTFNADNGKDYPFALRHNLTKQLRYLNKKYPDFQSFKDADITQIFDENQLNQTSVLEVNELNSVMLINMGNDEFKLQPLPLSVQFSPVYAITFG